METGDIDPATDDYQAAQRFIHAAHRFRPFRSPRTASFTMMVGFGGVRLLVKVHHGTLDSIHNLAGLRPLTSWDFAIVAPAMAWHRFWETVPDAGWHDVFALTRHNRMQVEGNLHPFMANLQFVKDLLASPRTEQDS